MNRFYRKPKPETMKKISNTTTMINSYLDKNELEVPEDEQILS